MNFEGIESCPGRSEQPGGRPQAGEGREEEIRQDLFVRLQSIKSKDFSLPRGSVTCHSELIVELDSARFRAKLNEIEKAAREIEEAEESYRHVTTLRENPPEAPKDRKN